MKRKNPGKRKRRRCERINIISIGTLHIHSVSQSVTLIVFMQHPLHILSCTSIIIFLWWWWWNKISTHCKWKSFYLKVLHAFNRLNLWNHIRSQFACETYLFLLFFHIVCKWNRKEMFSKLTYIGKYWWTCCLLQWRPHATMRWHRW